MLVSIPVSAQITGHIEANIGHSFTVGEATLPPGKYDFKMVPHSDLTVMRVTSPDGNTAAEFLVREAKANDTPEHTRLIFERYGNEEFLSKVFEAGHQLGVAVVEPSREELRLEKRGQHAVEHAEEVS